MYEVQDYDSNFLTTPLLTQLYMSVIIYLHEEDNCMTKSFHQKGMLLNLTTCC